VVLFAGAAGLTGRAQNAQNGAFFPPVTDEMLWKPSPSDWLSWRRTLDSQGYSPLKEIDRNNVSKLRMVWARGMGTRAPITVGRSQWSGIRPRIEKILTSLR